MLPRRVLRSARAALSIGALAALGLATAAAGPANAAISGDCPIDQNWAKIGGVTYTAANDTPGNAIELTAGETVEIEYLGTTTKRITDHFGAIAIALGPGEIVVEPWGSPNKPKPKLSKGGFYTFDVPDVVGIFDVVGFHSGKGGGCEGNAVLRITGKSPLATPWGAASAGGTVVAGAGVAYAMVARPRKGVA